MWKVDIYLETDSTFQGKKHRRCGYVLATQLRTGEKTKGGFGYTEGTYHQAILKTLAEAFFRMNKPAEICVHTQDPYVNSRLLKLDEMADAGWRNSKGELIKNAAEWKEVHEQYRNLSEEHGMKAYLCLECHREGPEAVHRCRETDLYLKRTAQEEFEKQNTRQQFIKIFGKKLLG